MALAVFAVVTALFFHHHFADQNQMIHFLKNYAIAGGLLQITAFGVSTLVSTAAVSVQYDHRTALGRSEKVQGNQVFFIFSRLESDADSASASSPADVLVAPAGVKSD